MIAKKCLVGAQKVLREMICKNKYLSESNKHNVTAVQIFSDTGDFSQIKDTVKE